ncbi:MAG TPA: endonuclease III [Phycisphaerales bacterium]|nr:endonuclease III [Phycisphaerales bacterium]
MANARKVSRRKPVEVRVPDAPAPGPVLGGPKRPFDIDRMLELIGMAVKGYRKAALFELADEGYGSPFEVLVGCIISVRTRDEVTVPTAKALFAKARTPGTVARLTPAKIDELIHACTFHGAKSRDIHEIARRIESEHGGKLPCSFEVLTGFRGVGPKCANLTLGVACGDVQGGAAELGIGVDVLVHRVTNRWGYVRAATPERTMVALHGLLPRKHWVAINRLLVPFGKHICTGLRPRCSVCPVRAYCRQVGVVDPR